MSDVVMGEAILALLDDNETISLYNLVVKLRTMVDSEEEKDRKQACENAISVIMESLAETQRSSSAEKGSQMQGWIPYGNETPRGDSNLH